MRIIICDRCKKEMPKDINNAGYVSLGLRDVRTGESSEISEFSNWDLCESCMNAILDCVQMVKHSKPMAESLVHGSEPVEIKPTATIKKKFSLDPEKVARIRQMGDDGKSIKEIAAYTGASEPTVRKYLT